MDACCNQEQGGGGGGGGGETMKKYWQIKRKVKTLRLCYEDKSPYHPPAVDVPAKLKLFFYSVD